jgi:hypothetical protein
LIDYRELSFEFEDNKAFREALDKSIRELAMPRGLKPGVFLLRLRDE